MNRSRSGWGGADSEYGADTHQRPRARNRQRKNWPDSARSSSRCRPEITTLTSPGPSDWTAKTRIRCRAACRAGVTNRYQKMAANTTMYSPPHKIRAGRLEMNSAPMANWWLNASATARYV